MLHPTGRRCPGRIESPAGDRGAVVLPDEQRRLLLEHAAAESPREACGLLLGRVDGRRFVVVEAPPARNAETADPERRFVLHPADLIGGEARAREAGLELLGAWHSHPRGDAAPSARDEREAQPGWLTLIAGLGSPAGPELRAWRLERGRLVEVRVS